MHVCHKTHDRKRQSIEHLSVFYYRIASLYPCDLVDGKCNILIVITDYYDIMRIVGNRRSNRTSSEAVAL